ncbi:hypothetical protein C8J56DRAFT_1165127 [Mycena floridula]|nr:hypothetical protein C8J56DRAFT_1165127 [Mycena floridula]
MVMVQLFRFIFLVSPTFASMTMEVPPVIKTDEIFTVSWTRAATDPAKFTVNILEGNGTPFLGGLSVTTTNVSGTFSVPAWAGVPPGVYFVEAVDSSNPSDVLGSSNKFTLLSASPTSLAPVDSTSRNNGPTSTSVKPGSIHSTLSSITGPVPALSATSISNSRISFFSSFSATISSGSTSHAISTSSGSKATTSVMSLASPSPSGFTSSNQHFVGSKLPIIIGCVVALLVVLSSLTLLLCYVRRRRRNRHHSAESPVSPFTDSEPASIPWIHGKVRQPFTISNGLRTSNTKTGTPHHSRDLGETASGTLVEAPDPSHRDNSDGSEEVPLEAAVEIERLRLENRILRRQIDGSSPVGETLPPSYPGSRSSSSNDHE